MFLRFTRYALIKSISFTLIVFLLQSTPLVDGATAHAKNRGQTDVCAQGVGRWIYSVNDFVVERQGIAKRPRKVDAFHTCSSKFNRGLVVNDFRAIRLGKAGRVYTTGDTCAPTPKMVYLTGRSIYTAASDSKGPVKTNFPHDLYVAFNREILGDLPNRVEVEVAQFMALVEQQCGKVPESIRIEGASDIPVVQRQRYNGPKPVNNFSYRTFYGGTLSIAGNNSYLEHDDKVLAKRFKEFALTRKNTGAARIALRNQRMEEGAALLMLGLLGVYQSSPCNDPELSNSEKPAECHR